MGRPPGMSDPLHHPRRETFFHGLDPRAKVLLVTGALVVVLSEPVGSVPPFGAYYALVTGLLLATRTPPGFLARRLAAVAPLVLAAAILILLVGEGSREMALSLVLRAFAAVALLTLLVATEETGEILWAMGALGMPRLFTTQSAFMLRFAHLLGEEVARTDRARRSRTPGPLRAGRIRTYGQQAALVFLRGWRRSQVVHQAMLARGFTGAFPVPPRKKLAPAHMAMVIVGLGAFVAVRLGWPS
jgi:cobalt/nickel transport system permease protein